MSVRRRMGRGQPLLDRFVLEPFPRLRGPFGFQDNNTTREFEYPWAYYATEIRQGMRAVEIGGGLGGFQFVLAHAGLEVVNVDPGLAANGRGWPVDMDSMARLNRAFGTHVHLQHCFLEEATIDRESVDRVFCISVLEHIPEDELDGLMRRCWSLMKPGSLFVATIDLFLNTKPFCQCDGNEFGANISVRRIVQAAPFELVHGEPRELYGFPDFCCDSVLSKSHLLLLGQYPAFVQTVVLRKLTVTA
jgi:hypothetical protein